jgi:CheY-like chemotaxis protein
MSTHGSDPRPVVLLAEDEPPVRMFNADVLDEAGYRVVEAANGEEAVSLFEARPDVRGVITDVEMPGSVDGFALARYVADRRPFVGVLIVSGRVRPRAEDMPDKSGFLAKPYSGTDLLQALRDVLAVHEMRRTGPGHRS